MHRLLLKVLCTIWKFLFLQKAKQNFTHLGDIIINQPMLMLILETIVQGPTVSRFLLQAACCLFLALCKRLLTEAKTEVGAHDDHAVAPPVAEQSHAPESTPAPAHAEVDSHPTHHVEAVVKPEHSEASHGAPVHEARASALHAQTGHTASAKTSPH